MSDDELTEVSWDEYVDPLTRSAWKEIDELKAERDRLRSDNERLGIKVVSLEMRIHGLESALEWWKEEEGEE